MISMEKTRIVIHGASGRMGQAIQRLALSEADLQLVALVTRGDPKARVLDQVPCYSARELDAVPDYDVMVDFSLPEGFDAALATSVRKGRAFVSGTTGLSEAQREALSAAGSRIPVLWASNFSLGVAVLESLVARAATSLPGWDCDIVESHHTAKKDAPSGTALTLGQAAEAGGVTVHYASLRAGDIVGEHLVQFSGIGERLELTHRATHRDIFARGALHAARWLRGRGAGLYKVADTLA